MLSCLRSLSALVPSTPRNRCNCLTGSTTQPLCPADEYRQEQLDYFSKTAAWTDVHPSQVVGSAACFKAYDLHTVTLEELKAPLKVGRAGLLLVGNCSPAQQAGLRRTCVV